MPTCRTTSKSGKWAWNWVFTSSAATFTMEKADPEKKWWFLYEGTIAGRFAPEKQFWGTDKSPRSSGTPDSKSQKFDHWQWIYFGDEHSPRVLTLAQHAPDKIQDTLWYLGSSDGGAATAPDGMVVFGFGRDPGAKPALQGTGTTVTVALVESVDHRVISRQVEEEIEKAATR